MLNESRFLSIDMCTNRSHANDMFPKYPVRTHPSCTPELFLPPFHPNRPTTLRRNKELVELPRTTRISKTDIEVTNESRRDLAELHTSEITAWAGIIAQSKLEQKSGGSVKVDAIQNAKQDRGGPAHVLELRTFQFVSPPQGLQASAQGCTSQRLYRSNPYCGV